MVDLLIKMLSVSLPEMRVSEPLEQMASNKNEWLKKVALMR
jgi:hypothetical protein